MNRGNKIKTVDRIAQSASMLQLNAALNWIHNYYIGYVSDAKMWKHTATSNFQSNNMMPLSRRRQNSNS